MKKCTACGDEVSAFFMCDEDVRAELCFKCFAVTPCGRGEHGEGCPTGVIEDVRHVN